MRSTKVLFNAYRACLGRPSRTIYQREYRIELLQPDGSTIPARYKEPRHLFRMPIDLRVAAEDEKRRRLALRKPQQRQLKDDIIDDNFNADEYLSIVNKK